MYGALKSTKKCKKTREITFDEEKIAKKYNHGKPFRHIFEISIGTLFFFNFKSTVQVPTNHCFAHNAKTQQMGLCIWN